MKVTASSSAVNPSIPYRFKVPTSEYRSLPIPGLRGARLGDCFVRVSDLPVHLDQFMQVNPRVPSRSQKGVLSGPVVRGITQTLLDNPEDMVIKNQGIYLLVHDASFDRIPGGDGVLEVTLSDPALHGIVNGGHTYAAIRDAIENADDDELNRISSAQVRLHILQGIDESKVAEIAEGLNRSKQVDDPSLANLQGHFATIKKVMEGERGADSIAYNQGGDGEVYIAEVLVFLEMFNRERYDRKRHPNSLYNRAASALQLYEKDLLAQPSPVELLVPQLPQILKLADMIRRETPVAAKRIGFEFGQMKTGRVRAGAKSNRHVPLPFLGETMRHRVPNGWLYPMMAAFRANVDWDLKKKRFAWKIPLQKLVPAVIDDLVGVCVGEHRENKLAPDKIGKRESTYAQCYDKLQLYLLESAAD